MNKSVSMNKSALEIFIALHNTRAPEDAFPDELHKLTDKYLERVTRKLLSDVISHPHHRKFQKSVWREIKQLIIESIDTTISEQLDKALNHDD